MTLFFTILLAASLQALVSFSGALLAIFNESRIKQLTHFVVSFAVGALLGVALLDLIPEALALGGMEFESLAFYTFGGIIFFFILEKFFLWRHNHEGGMARESYTELILWGDFLHNFIDGAIIALTFMVDVRIGIATTIAVIFHEIPQEISDFGILIHGGMSRTRAISYNFLVSLSTIAGALITFAASAVIEPVLPYALALTAGNFIYIAVADLIPELHESTSIKHTALQLLFICLGVFLVIAPERFLL